MDSKAESEFDGFIIVDLPSNEAMELIEAARKRGLSNVPLVPYQHKRSDQDAGQNGLLFPLLRFCDGCHGGPCRLALRSE
mmetsp:Transcript_63864/g.76771  ORF Transcript_63864/g.76771 Transcript_63864/m.76771 type:complete len:80 (+) Transcript_63864:116-355(+)